MIRTREDLERAAAAAGAVLLSTETVTLKDGSTTLAGRFGFDDPWAAARLLCILAEEDADDPEVRAWAETMWTEAAAAMGLDVRDPMVLDAFLEVVHANVQQWIAFVPEEGERFQSARTTMIQGEGDCDCQARLVHALARSMGAGSEIRFFEDKREPVHAAAALETSSDGYQWAETTIDADFGEHPQDAYRRLGLDQQNARPDIGGSASGSASDDVVELQALMKQSYLATALAVEACHALSPDELASWDALAKSVLAYDSADPSSVDLATGQGLAAQLNAFAGVLRAAGCQAPIPAPIPQPAPKPQPGPSPLDTLVSAVKAVAIGVGVVAGAVAVVKVAEVAGARRRATA